MAFIAGRGVRSPSSQGSSVNTGIELLIGHIVAHSTVYPFQIFWVGEFLHIGVLMAGDAVRIFVDRFRVSFEIHVHGDGPSLSPCG
jgi:hypothetical protein